jgi:hypothetical protein
MIEDDAHARRHAEAVLERATAFSWAKTAAVVRGMYRDALERRGARD